MNRFSIKKVHTPINSNINERRIAISFEITKAEVDEKNFTRITNMIEFLGEYERDGRAMLQVYFSGFKSRDITLFENDNLCFYVKEIFNLFPNIFYFLGDLHHNRTIIKMFLANKESNRSLENEVVNRNPDEKTIGKIIDGVLDYGIVMEDEEEALWEYIDDIFVDKPEINLTEEYLKAVFL